MTVALERHYGPGDHPSGTPQAAHGGKGGTATGGVAKAEAEIRGLRGGERAVVFDMEGEEILRKTSMGDPDGPGPLIAGVDFEPDEMGYMQSECWVFTHNHPDGWNYPPSDPRHAGNGLSRNDLTLAATIGPMELRAVTPTRVFSLKPGPRGWGDPAEINQMALATDAAVRWEFTDRIIRGYPAWGVTQEERITHAEVAHADEVTRRLAAEYGWIYQVVEQ